MSAREVSFDSGGCTLAGTYAEAANPIAAALLITGSGKTDRDSDVHLPLHQMLRGGITRQVSDALVSAQVSTLRYDKRGVGASGGDYLSVGMAQRLADARAALGWLAATAAGLPLLAIGHSEGTYYAAQLAADVDVAGAVLLSGPARTGAEVLSWQTQKMAERLPRSARVILRLMRTDAIRAQRKNMDRILASSEDVMRIQGSRVNARWVRDFAAYDPRPALSRVTVPVLAITGGEDVQVPPEDVEAIGQLVRGPFDGDVIADLSHMLRPDPASIGPRGYRRATRQPVSPEVLGLITGWVTSHWGTQARPGGKQAAAGSGN
jgi:pimeloyl-ACP methyl ester carboxylesterase